MNRGRFRGPLNWGTTRAARAALLGVRGKEVGCEKVEKFWRTFNPRRAFEFRTWNFELQITSPAWQALLGVT